ncbi:sulfatase-modifying factor protein [Rhodanobacter sp. Soil772]|uniref:formylglycine-generating enzyme family protein n=1 Tax=Rhodanobacter sp. Soil772 TaxID=1736406 RepID=UPI0006F47682|nr:formylglycine-generating enzyme family protein [Rhodanobacter sp. Soil772]KRE86919.1 sulfatase-modifying factor protein [Rhodanobacter sp. Soil772]
MPNNATLRRQRTLGGALGVIVLGFALTYHFFPRLFHVDPTQAPRRSMSLGAATPGSGLQPERVSAINELNAGPPLTLAPTAVIVARNSKNANLPEQLSADPPEVQALLDRATSALHAGQLVGDGNSAAALFQQALKDKPDSRRAVQGLFDVRARLVAEIDQDIAVGDVDAAQDLLGALRTLPNAEAEVTQLEASLKVLEKVRPMLAKAAALLQQGRADQPAGGSALDLYREVQTLDPQNAVAEQGIFQVQRAVLDRALAAVAQNDFAGADRELAKAQAIRPGSQQMIDVHKRVDDIREQRANGVLAQAHSALDAGNVGLATKLAAQVRAIDPSLAALAAFDEQLTNARLYASYKPGQVFIDRYVDLPGKAPAMVVIPTGSFQMGASAADEDRIDAAQPQHTITVSKGFAMARTAVTVAEFREFVRASGYVPDSVKLGGASVYDERSGALHDDPDATWQDDYAGRKADDRLPVVNVSWNDAKAYADWLGQRTGKTYRLPSEAEFEYALRGGTSGRYWWGDDMPTRQVENLTGSGDRSRSGRRWSHAFRNYRDGYWGPAPAMSFAANPFGLYDINGNVSEWVQDCWHDNYVRAPNDGSAWINPGCRSHVVRGGSWGSSPDQVDSAYRQGADGDLRSGRVGFRVVREL